MDNIESKPSFDKTTSDLVLEKLKTCTLDEKTFERVKSTLKAKTIIPLLTTPYEINESFDPESKEFNPQVVIDSFKALPPNQMPLVIAPLFPRALKGDQMKAYKDMLKHYKFCAKELKSGTPAHQLLNHHLSFMGISVN